MNYPEPDAIAFQSGSRSMRLAGLFVHRHLRTARIGSPLMREISCSSSKPDPEQLRHVGKGCLRGLRGMSTKYHALYHNGQFRVLERLTSPKVCQTVKVG
jgi:hypothetical protein